MTQRLCHSKNRLGQTDLVRITGADAVTVLRLRQRAERIVYHVSLHNAAGQETGQGAIWCFAGDKARRVAKRHPASIVDAATNALFDRFPADHRLPEIAAYLHWVTHDAPTPQRAANAPDLLRYRPGLSCTFRADQLDGQRVYTKVIAKEDIAALAGHHARMAASISRPGVRFIRPVRIQPEFRAITYEAAQGEALQVLLRNDDPHAAIAACRRVVVALQSLAGTPHGVRKSLCAADLCRQAEKSRALVAGRCGRAAALAQALLNRVGAPPRDFGGNLIHGDVKTDHLFLTARAVTFIDTESMATGDPRYDLACLEASLIVGAIRKDVSARLLAACRDLSRQAAGPGYDWFLAIARLRAARYFAQRPGPGNLTAITQALEL